MSVSATSLALAGGLIVAAESAKFADTHARRALTPVWGVSQRLPRRVGLAKAQARGCGAAVLRCLNIGCAAIGPPSASGCGSRSKAARAGANASHIEWLAKL